MVVAPEGVKGKEEGDHELQESKGNLPNRSVETEVVRGGPTTGADGGAGGSSRWRYYREGEPEWMVGEALDSSRVLHLRGIHRGIAGGGAAAKMVASSGNEEDNTGGEFL